MAIYSGFSHETWWFSIVMLVYQRVIWMINDLSNLEVDGSSEWFFDWLMICIPVVSNIHHEYEYMIIYGRIKKHVVISLKNENPMQPSGW